MFKKIVAIITCVSIMMLWALLVTTSPSSAGPLGILIFFVLMYTAALGALTFLFYGIGLIALRATGMTRGKIRFGEISFQKAYYYASVGGLAPVMLIAMQSVSQVGFYQFLLVIFFIVVAWIYVAKRTT